MTGDAHGVGSPTGTFSMVYSRRSLHPNSHRDEQRGEGMYESYSEEIPESTYEGEANEIWADHIAVRKSTRDRRQHTRVQEFTEDGNQRTSAAAV